MWGGRGYQRWKSVYVIRDNADTNMYIRYCIDNTGVGRNVSKYRGNLTPTDRLTVVEMTSRLTLVDALWWVGLYLYK